MLCCDDDEDDEDDDDANDAYYSSNKSIYGSCAGCNDPIHVLQAGIKQSENA